MLAAATGPSSIIAGVAILFTIVAFVVSLVWSVVKRLFGRKQP